MPDVKSETPLIQANEYLVQIEGSSFGFKLLTPSNIGNGSHFTIRNGKKKDIRVSFKNVGLISPPLEEFSIVQKVNAKIWSILFPDRAEFKHNEIQTAEQIPIYSDKEEYQYPRSYSDLSKTFLIIPTTIQKNGSTPVVAKNILERLMLEPVALSPGSVAIDDVYYCRSKKLCYLIKKRLLHVNSKLKEFVELYCDILSGPDEIKHDSLFQATRERLGMKNIDLDNTSFIEYFTPKNTSINDIPDLWPVVQFINEIGSIDNIRQAEYLAFGVEAITGQSTSKEQLYTNKELSHSSWEGKDVCVLQMKDLYNTGIPAAPLDVLNTIPSIMMIIERFAQVREYKIYNNFTFMKDYLVLKSLSSCNYDSVLNNETLEILGDSVLKSIISLHLFKTFPDKNEDFLTRQRAELVNNNYLASKGLGNGIQFFLKSSKASLKSWSFPRLTTDIKTSKIDTEQQLINSKMVADATEALIGAGFASTSRLYEALSVIKGLGILEAYDFEKYNHFFLEKLEIPAELFKVLKASLTPNASYRKVMGFGESSGILKNSKVPYKMDKRVKRQKRKAMGSIMLHSIEDGSQSELLIIGDKMLFKNYSRDKLIRFNGTSHYKMLHSKYISDFEREYLGYSFKNRSLIKNALRPYLGIRKGPNNEFNRLEYLGDAIIELMTIHYTRETLIKLKKSYSPEILHGFKVMMLSTEGLARIFMHLKLHRFIEAIGIPANIIEPMVEFMREYSPRSRFISLWWTTKAKVKLL